MAYPSRIVVSSLARTATGDSGPLVVGGPLQSSQGATSLSLLVDVTAVSGTTPTMALTVQWSPNGIVFASPDGTADAFTSITAVTQTVRRFDIKAPWYRVVWTLGGTTPSFTFAVHEAAQGG